VEFASIQRCPRRPSNIYIGAGTVLYSDRGSALFTVIADTCGRHDIDLWLL
jgi:hypothetical protein